MFGPHVNVAPLVAKIRQRTIWPSILTCRWSPQVRCPWPSGRWRKAGRACILGGSAAYSQSRLEQKIHQAEGQHNSGPWSVGAFVAEPQLGREALPRGRSRPRARLSLSHRPLAPPCRGMLLESLGNGQARLPGPINALRRLASRIDLNDCDLELKPPKRDARSGDWPPSHGDNHTQFS